MRRSMKKTYLFLALLLIICSFASVVNVNAWGHRSKVNYRSLDDWTLNNPRVVYGFTTNWDLLPEGYTLLPKITNPDQYCGFITEKVLDDGRAEITVFIIVINCEIQLYRLQDWFNMEPQDLLVDTHYYCIAIEKFILPEAGMEIPLIFYVWLGFIGEWVSSYSIGFGSGTFTEYAANFGFSQGETGKVFLHMMSYLSAEGEEIWPYEIIEVYE